MEFLKSVIEQNIPIWQKCMESEFVQAMGKGTLEKGKFKNYIIQDSIYLRQYARVLALGIVKAEDMEQVRAFYSFLSFVNESEDSTRIKYLKDFGISPQQADSREEKAENKAYTDFMMKCAGEGRAAEILMSALPCMLSYHWIFTRLVKEYPDSLNGYFSMFLRDYISVGYLDTCKYWSRYTEKLCENYSPRRKEKLAEIFKESSEHELNFWKMSNG